MHARQQATSAIYIITLIHLYFQGNDFRLLITMVAGSPTAYLWYQQVGVSCYILLYSQLM